MRSLLEAVSRPEEKTRTHTTDAIRLTTMIRAPCLEFALVGRVATTIPRTKPISGIATAVM